MFQPAWDEIEQLYSLPGIDSHTIQQFKDLKSSQPSHTKAEACPLHYCSFFLPYDESVGKIYLGHHKKADDWVPLAVTSSPAKHQAARQSAK